MTIRVSSPLLAIAMVLAGSAAPAAAEITPQGTIKGMEKVSNADFRDFNLYSMKIEEFGTSPDGNYQAVVTLRNRKDERVSVEANHVDLTMIDGDGVEIKDDGNLYSASTEGNYLALNRHQNTIYLEPEKEVRIRLAFGGSRGFAPQRVKLAEMWGSPVTVTYKVGK